MDLTICAEFENKEYFRALYHLQKKGKIDKINIITTRFHHLIIQKICYNSSFLRKIIECLLKKKITHINPPLRKIADSCLIPFRLLKDKKIVVFIAPYHPLIYLLVIYRMIGKKYIYNTSWPDWSGNRYPNLALPFTKRLWSVFLKNNIVVTVSDKAEKDMKSLGVKCFRIPHSVDTKKFNILEKRKGKEIRILFVGRLDEEKGIQIILDASKKFKKSNVKFYFAGKGEYAEKIKSLEKELPVKLLGYVDNEDMLVKIYNDSDIFVLPSISSNRWEELFGIVLIEAMSCGLPVIASDCVGPKEIIDNGKTGFVIPQNNVEELVEKLDMLINNKELREKMGIHGRQKAVRDYDLEKNSNEWYKILNIDYKRDYKNR